MLHGSIRETGIPTSHQVCSFLMPVRCVATLSARGSISCRMMMRSAQDRSNWNLRRRGSCLAEADCSGYLGVEFKHDPHCDECPKPVRRNSTIYHSRKTASESARI